MPSQSRSSVQRTHSLPVHSSPQAILMFPPGKLPLPMGLCLSDTLGGLSLSPIPTILSHLLTSPCTSCHSAPIFPHRGFSCTLPHPTSIFFLRSCLLSLSLSLPLLPALHLLTSPSLCCNLKVLLGLYHHLFRSSLNTQSGRGGGDETERQGLYGEESSLSVHWEPVGILSGKNQARVSSWIRSTLKDDVRERFSLCSQASLEVREQNEVKWAKGRLEER